MSDDENLVHMECTEATVERIDALLDDLDIFAKAYTAVIDGKITTIGWRIGKKPNHVIAFWGDSVALRPDGTVTVERAALDEVTPQEKP